MESVFSSEDGKRLSRLSAVTSCKLSRHRKLFASPLRGRLSVQRKRSYERDNDGLKGHRLYLHTANFYRQDLWYEHSPDAGAFFAPRILLGLGLMVIVAARMLAYFRHKKRFQGTYCSTKQGLCFCLYCLQSASLPPAPCSILCHSDPHRARSESRRRVTSCASGSGGLTINTVSDPREAKHISNQARGKQATPDAQPADEDPEDVQMEETHGDKGGRGQRKRGGGGEADAAQLQHDHG